MSPSAKLWLQASLFSGLYFLAGYHLTGPGLPATLIVLWAPAGIALATFLLFGARFWFFVTIPAFALAVWLTGSIASAMILATAATVQAWAGAFLLQRLGFGKSLNGLRHVLVFTGVAIVSPLVSVVVREVWRFLPLPQTGFVDPWLHWRGDAIGILFIAPFLFSWWTPFPLRSFPRVRMMECALLFALLLAACFIVFSGKPGQGLGFILVPLGMWGALRFGLRTVSALNLIVAMAGFAGALHRLGQFGAGSLPDRMLTFSGFLFVAALLNLSFYAVFSERTEARDMRSRLADILENTTDFVGTADIHGNATFVNSAGRWMVGLKANDDISKMKVSDFHPSWASEMLLKEGIPEALATGYWRGETALQTRDGGEIPVSQVVLAHKTDGQVQFMSTIARDITEEKRADTELRLSEERFSKAFRATPDWITISTLADGRYIEVNDAFLRASGYRRDEVIGNTTSELNIWMDFEERAAVLNILATQGRVLDREIRFRNRTGRAILGSMSAEVIEVGGQKCLLAVVRDLTRSKQMEDQLRQAQKMEAVGRLAAGIAHDFNNLLVVIQGYTELQIDALSPDDPSRKGMEEVRLASDRAAALTRQLLAFSRKQVLEPKVLDLNAILDDVSKLLRRLIGANVQLETILDPDLGRIKADPSQVEQILINLVVNARDAMPEGGRITVETASVELDASFAETRPEVVPGKYVMMAVSDTGIGMDGATQAKIFEPFFTTKERDKGTGLGLATVYGIVKQSNGYIYVYSEPGRGTTFKVFMPQVEEALTVIARVTPPVDTRGDEHILLVEDEEAVRNLARDFLGLKGYKVIAASSGADAVHQMANYPGQIDLLLTDLIMPNMGGRQLANILRKRWPDLQVLFISGYTDDAILRAGTLMVDEEFLQKPFALTTLATRVRQALGPKAAGASGDAGS